MRPYLFWGLLITFLLAAPFDLSAVQNLVLEPSLKTKMAINGKFMDITRAGDRFVAVGEKGHVFYSDDNGLNWIQADVPVSVTLTSVAFPTPDKGWIVGHQGVVLGSTDGGATWQKKLDAATIISKSFESCKNLYKLQERLLANATDAERPLLEERLEFAGFYVQDMEIFAKDKLSKPLMSINFSSELDGIIVGGLGIVLKTDDGGEKWSSQIEQVGNVDGYNFFDILTDDEGLYIAGESGLLFSSRDKGDSWQRVGIPFEATIYALLSAPDDTCVFVIGFGGDFLRSCDGGETWKINSLTVDDKTLYGGIALRDKRLLLFGAEPEVFVSDDNGESFKRTLTGVPAVMSASETDDGYLLLAGLAGIKRISLNSIVK